MRGSQGVNGKTQGFPAVGTQRPLLRCPFQQSTGAGEWVACFWGFAHPMCRKKRPGHRTGQVRGMKLLM